MSDELRIGAEGRDDEVTRTLRSVYQAPLEPGYWDRLAARIMSRIAAEDEQWWQPFREWVRGGLIAAGFTALIVGLALGRARRSEAELAYRTIIETPRTLSLQLATETTGLPGREATLRYVTAP
ncbi:MAG: hypothetical protein M3068_05355 [Gemmatimonadota bacterium]|nr:hypothetical protein [Gemmatimonadota bacterium]